MQAWAPPTKEAEELEHWDSRPLRQRERTASCVGQASLEASELERCLSTHDKAINWRALEVPLASQIKGLALLQEDGGKVPRLLAQPPRPQPVSVPQPPGNSGKPGRHLTSLQAHGVAPAPVHTARRPNHAHAEHRSPPPMRTGITSDASLGGRPVNRGMEARSPPLPPRGVIRAYGVSPAYRELHRDQRQMDRNGGAQHRKSSPWHSRADRIGKAGKFLVHMPGR
ncbi:kif19 [Symbiodinium pilosum]|uniref:Kif19 protein n=1 Tax=Symbiodinium pilosum TaxID=2952 RepID=A0A812JRC4_SYMPI|nr:kif19 [Symbiodinium pilosum]